MLRRGKRVHTTDSKKATIFVMRTEDGGRGGGEVQKHRPAHCLAPGSLRPYKPYQA